MSRPSRPCGRPEQLRLDQLLGEKGSFTGATEKQVGKFEQADRTRARAGS